MPPVNKGNRLSAVARAEMGHPRTCEACDETKEVSRSTFTPSKSGKRGWKTICKVCENLERSEKVKEDKSHLIEITAADKSDLINEMYLLHMSNQKPTRVDEIASSIGQEIRDLHEGGDDKESFELFIDLVKPLVAGWMEPGSIHEDIKDGLLSTHRRRLIIATRYSAKSTLCSIYVAWRIFLDPFIKIMVVSRGAKLAARMLRTVRRVFIANCPALAHLSPTEDCLDNAEQFQTPQSMQVVTGGATLTSLGMGSNLPGFRADLTIGDDVEGPQDDTPEKVMALEEALNELHMINPRGEKVLLGTYQTEFSIYAKLADLRTTDGDEEAEVPVWETHRACMFEVDKLDGKEVIHSRWSSMFSDKDGTDWRKSVTLRAWRLHVLLIADPSILNERPLKIQDLPVLDFSPKAGTFPVTWSRTSEQLVDMPRWSAPKGDNWYAALPSSELAPLASVIMAVDPASGLAGRDAIGTAILGITQGGAGIILHLEGVRAANKEEAMRRVARLAKEYSATTIVVEELADGLFGETLESALVLENYPSTVEKVTTGNQQKGRRIIENLAPPMGAGRIAILYHVATTDHGGEFVNQLVRITYDGRTGSSRQHDDIVDALAHAVQREKHSLVSDISDNIAEHRRTRYDDLARVPLRYGGLGGSDDDEHPNTRRFQDVGLEGSLGERLVEEDTVLIALEARRDALMGILQEDIRLGRYNRMKDGAKEKLLMQGRIQTLTNQIKELKEHQVL
jgi:hypothetical protein